MEGSTPPINCLQENRLSEEKYSFAQSSKNDLLKRTEKNPHIAERASRVLNATARGLRVSMPRGVLH